MLKTEIERNFQIDFMKLMLKHKGNSTEERKVLQIGLGGWLCLAAFIMWGQSRLLKVAFYLITLPDNHVHTCTWVRWLATHYCTPARL